MLRNMLMGLIVLGLVIVGCATTPQSIQDLSAKQGQTIDILYADTLDIIDTYDAELHHWVVLAHRKVAEGMIAKHTNAEGDVDLQAYLEDMQVVNQNMLEVIDEYDSNRAALITSVGGKFEAAKKIQITIDAFERSAGFNQGDIDSLLSNFTEMTVTLLDKPKKEKKPDLLDIFYDQIMGALVAGLGE